MILGIGSDIVDVRRMARVIDRHGDRFLERIFTGTERAKAERRARRVETYAKRFAAKEACAKALGTGLRAGVFWRDMGVVNLPSGRPTMQLTGGALARLGRFVLRAATVGRELPWTPSTFRGGLYFDRRLWVDLQPVRWPDPWCREPQPPARTLCIQRSACGRISPPE